MPNYHFPITLIPRSVHTFQREPFFLSSTILPQLSNALENPYFLLVMTLRSSPMNQVYEIDMLFPQGLSTCFMVARQRFDTHGPI